MLGLTGNSFSYKKKRIPLPVPSAFLFHPLLQIEILRERIKSKHLKFRPEEHERLLALGNQFDHQVEGAFLIGSLQNLSTMASGSR